MTAVRVIDTVELPTFTEGVANIEETLPTEGEGVSLKNELIPELTLSGVGVGLALRIVVNISKGDGVICSVTINELALDMLLVRVVGVTMVTDTL